MNIYKLVYWIVQQSRWLPLWSTIYRIGQRKYKKSYTLDNYTDPVLLQADLDKIEYSKDTWKQLWDVCSSPYYSKFVLETAKKYDQVEGPFDCDDYACLAANMLDVHYHPFLLGVSYKEKDKFKFRGHMVCVFETIFGFRYMGNWGLSPVFKTVESIAYDIARRADCTLIGYTEYTKDLGVIKVHI